VIKETKQALVTIIIPAFNHEKYVGQALLSAIRQDYANLEILVIDDGSTDGTAAVIEEVLARSSNDREVKFIRQPNQGLSRTLNRGLEMAQGDFVQLLASDDAYLPAKTRVCVDRLSALPVSVGAIYCDGYVVDEDNNKLMKFSERFPKPFSANTHKELLVGNWIPAMGLFYRKEALLAVGKFDESIQVEDWELLLRLTGSFKVSSIPDLLFLYRSHASNYSNDRVRMLSQQDAIAEKHDELRRFMDFIESIRDRSIAGAVRNLSFLNCELTARAILRHLRKLYWRRRVSRRADGGSAPTLPSE
jgi:glycosyltransferase involved in cell wall biosynthesis